MWWSWGGDGGGRVGWGGVKGGREAKEDNRNLSVHSLLNLKFRLLNFMPRL